MQPFIRTEKGVIRFQANAIVRDLLDKARAAGVDDLNEIACREYTQEDRCQFAQLIGYSLSGYHELSYVSDEHARLATEEARRSFPEAMGCRDRGCPIHTGVPSES